MVSLKHDRSLYDTINLHIYSNILLHLKSLLVRDRRHQYSFYLYPNALYSDSCDCIPTAHIVSSVATLFSTTNVHNSSSSFPFRPRIKKSCFFSVKYTMHQQLLDNILNRKAITTLSLKRNATFLPGFFLGTRVRVM